MGLAVESLSASGDGCSQTLLTKDNALASSALIFEGTVELETDICESPSELSQGIGLIWELTAAMCVSVDSIADRGTNSEA